MIVRHLAILLAAIVLTPAAAAQTAPTASAVETVDANIRYVEYNPNAVIRLVGHTGYQIIMEFERGEKIETVGLGDSAGWQVTPNGSGTVIFLKPAGLARTTNMAIVTNLRRYNLELIARSGLKARQSDIIYALRFRYPKAEPVAPPPAASPPPLIMAPPEQWNRAYSYDGAKGNVPELVFDDGKATYFRFAAATATPAIFSITPDAGESIVNYAVRGPYVVVEQIAPQFVLRQGKDVTFIFNDAFAAPAPGADAPKPRAKRKKGLFGGLFGAAPKEAKP